MAQPPFYILIARSNSITGAPSNTLAHPTIQYHYRDDSPSSFWPQRPNEHVLVLDFDPATTSLPRVQSLSKDLIISGLRIEEAPGAPLAEENSPRNADIYIIDTTFSEVTNDSTYGDPTSAHSILHFKRRNMILRRALLYPGILARQTEPSLHLDS